MKVALYARVSQPSIQDAEDKVSIDQQLADMRSLCKRNEWEIVEEFIDRETYKATQLPKRGKIVNPSGERADRPQFLAMLKVVKMGKVDAILCWRDDRLVRHPRVAVALEDALDIGDMARNSKDKIEIYDATGSMIDRFTLSIKATIWREENKRRAERTRMGKIATLQQGYWPGAYKRYGYVSHKAVRGRSIEINEEESQVVLTVHKMFDAGTGVRDIRRYLMGNDIEQKGHQSRRHEWHVSIIYNILRAEDYTGTAIWKFADGKTMAIEIPPIIPQDLWKRNQERLERNRILSTRNAAGIYLLQGIGYCGDCDTKLSVRKQRAYTTKKGQRRPYKNPPHDYYCHKANNYLDEPHPRPFTRTGTTLDWLVWRQIADNGIRQPDLIRGQVQVRQAELRAQGEGFDGDIAHARQRLADIDGERSFYQRQAARRKMTEAEFDNRMDETEEARQYWQSELARLQELRDNRAKVEAGLEYTTELLSTLQEILPTIDQTPKELKALPREQRDEVLRARQMIIRALCDKVMVYADGRVVIKGLLDGSEAAQFELGTPSNC